MRKLVTICALALLPLLAGACASSGPKAERVDRMTLMEQHMARISAEIAELRQQNRENADDVEELRKLLDGNLEELRTEFARYSVKVDSIDSSLGSIKEKVDDSEMRITNLRKEINELRYTRTYGGYSRPDETVPGAETQPATDRTEETTGGEAGRPGLGESDSYQAAYADFVRGEYSLALTGFREFLRAYPGSDRADAAQFYIGECLYNLGEFEAAVEEYDAVILHYATSQFKLTATYKKALSFLNSNQTAQGVILLQQLIRQYPDSNEARLARQRLSSLGLNP
jgi:tol-pal system protein YbgF